MNDLLIIIMTRAGSKRLPEKNIKLFAEKSLVEITMEQAVRIQNKLKKRNYCSLQTTVVLHTDCKKTLELSKKYKTIKIVKRPPELSLDATMSEENIHYILKNTEKHKNFLLLQVTSPLRWNIDIENIIEYIRDCKCAVSVNNDNKYNGALYISDCDYFLENKTFVPQKYYKMPSERSIDIDTQKDFNYAEKIYKEYVRSFVI